MAIHADAPVIVVGAGLAGLACAQLLTRLGVDVLVCEAAEVAGGRVRTDVIDGFRCDRGFQLLNPSYPVLREVLEDAGLDRAVLDLRAFEAGVVVAHGSQRWVLADPRREPLRLLPTLRAPLGSTAEKLRFAAWAARTLLPVRRLLAGEDRTLASDLDAAGVTGILRTGVIEPFLGGVLAERDGSTSAHLAALLVRSFLLGSPSVPSLGMSRFPELIASSLPVGTVRPNTPVRSVTPTAVRTDDGEIAARAVVVATDPTTAADLTGIPAAVMKGLTTFWYTAPLPPSRQRLLYLDADARGPVINSGVLSNVAPTYAPAGRPLIAATTLGADASREAEDQVRRHLAQIYGAETAGWELVTAQAISDALPAQPPPLHVRQPAALPSGILVAGDHRDTASIQGALVSGRRAATAVLDSLARPSTTRLTPPGRATDAGGV